jgi:rubrerythrin
MYTFTKEQLNDLLFGTIGMFIEYRDLHDKTEENARFAAVNEMFEGLDAERELVDQGEAKAITQIINDVPLPAEHPGDECPKCGYIYAAHGPNDECPVNDTQARGYLDGA